MSFDGEVPPAAESRPVVRPGTRGFLVAVMVLGVLLVVVPAASIAGDTRAGRLDRWIQSGVDKIPQEAHRLMLATDWLGEPAGRTLLVLAVAALCVAARRRALAVTAVVASVLVAILTVGLKYAVDRRIHDGFLSYPSGHTAAIATLGLVLGLLLSDLLRTGPALGTAVVLAGGISAGALMALAQIGLTAHYPTDTVGGVGSALVVVPATGLLIDRFGRRPR